MIRKFAGQRKWGLYSSSAIPGKRLGVFKSKKAAEAREKQIKFFKHGAVEQ